MKTEHAFFWWGGGCKAQNKKQNLQTCLCLVGPRNAKNWSSKKLICEKDTMIFLHFPQRFDDKYGESGPIKSEKMEVPEIIEKVLQ